MTTQVSQGCCENSCVLQCKTRRNFLADCIPRLRDFSCKGAQCSYSIRLLTRCSVGTFEILVSRPLQDSFRKSSDVGFGFPQSWHRKKSFRGQPPTSKIQTGTLVSFQDFSVVEAMVEAEVGGVTRRRSISKVVVVAAGQVIVLVR